jgi:WD40 repeat protein
MAAHRGGARAVAFADNGRWAVSGGEDGSVRVWDIGAGTERKRLAAGGAVFCAAVGPDGSVWAGTEAGAVVGWPAALGR